MKLILLIASILCLMSFFALGQSSIEIQPGAIIEVTAGADICADNIVINGTLSGDGTTCAGLGISANIKVFLQGCYNGSGAMTILLNANEYIPISQPYNNPPWNYSGLESVISIPSGVVDWILVELRTDETTLLSKRAGFLKSDGTITDLDGSSQLFFPGITIGNYYIVIQHRNHLAIMSSTAVALDAVSPLYDFTTAQTQAYGTDGMKDFGDGNFGLLAADGNGDGNVNALDRNAVWRIQNGTDGYLNGDYNLNGSANAIDRNAFWRVNNGISTQVP